jgi:predicted RNA binding protein YcfA (HicA-like mRNA interferase family)
MARLPVLKPREIARVLAKWDFCGSAPARSSQTISPRRWTRNNRCIRGGRDISPFLLRQIVKDIRLTPEEFLRELR